MTGLRHSFANTVVDIYWPHFYERVGPPRSNARRRDSKKSIEIPPVRGKVRSSPGQEVRSRCKTGRDKGIYVHTRFTFPYAFTRYAREDTLPLLPLAHAIHTLTRYVRVRPPAAYLAENGCGDREEMCERGRVNERRMVK